MRTIPIFSPDGLLANADEIKEEISKQLAAYGKSVNIDSPDTLQDKIIWLTLYEPITKKTLCADKYKVREYCLDKLGKDICVPLIAVYDNVDEIEWEKLPNSFVIKCNHGFHMNIIVKDKSKLDTEDAMFKLSHWINYDFALAAYEVQYEQIPRKIVVEEYLNDGHDDLIDYKFLCFNGKPTFCQIISDRHNDLRRLNYYDMDFNFVDICRKEFPNNPNLLDEKPVNFDLMKEYAQKLSEDFKFVRVDFYDINGTIYLGELTFTPGAYRFCYKNPQDDFKMGQLLKI